MKHLLKPFEAKEFCSNLTEFGFVPTMGALHNGHISLIQASQKQNPYTLVSIFLNPTQFNNPQDFQQYPVNLEEDLKILEELEVDAVFLPQVEDMYPDGYHYKITEDNLSRDLCGKTRLGHFDGVLTVVMKLLQIVRPNRAYFGEKDYQQLKLVKDMVQAFFMDVEIVACPTVRSSEGLALSSRNKRLSPEGIEKAQYFAQQLRSVTSLTDLEKQLNAIDISVDYLEEHLGRRFAAVHIENVRLIDNVPL